MSLSIVRHQSGYAKRHGLPLGFNIRASVWQTILVFAPSRGERFNASEILWALNGQGAGVTMKQVKAAINSLGFSKSRSTIWYVR